MYIIDAHFERLSDIAIPDLLGAIGVYVLWSGRARARPSYIGEGNVLKRLALHHDNFAKPFDGFAAVLSEDGVSRQRAKADATIVEAMLLEVAHHTDRSPSTNVAWGKLRGLDDIFERHGVVRIKVSGLDPLRPPEECPRIDGCKCIELRTSHGGVGVKHAWRLRKLRT